ncbi:MAG TPA: DUF2065 domain-containing protein [Burkholderiaceae bacterium]
MGDLFLSAVALVLVFEGMVPFVSPGTWRRVFERAVKMTDHQIRLFGLASLALGAGLLVLFRG